MKNICTQIKSIESVVKFVTYYFDYRPSCISQIKLVSLTEGLYIFHDIQN